MAQESTRKTLMKCMRKLMREKSFARISIDDICSFAGISRRNFYRYFLDKYELLNCVYYEYFFSKLVIREDWNVWDYFPLICRQCYEEREFFKHAFKVKGQNSLWRYARDLLAPLIKQDFKDTFLSDGSADFYIDATTNTLFSFMDAWVNSEPCLPPEEFASYVRRSVALHALRTYEIASTDNTNSAPNEKRQPLQHP